MTFFSSTAVNSFHWTQKRASTLAGVSGCAAAACVFAASGISHNPSLLFASIAEFTGFTTMVAWGKNDHGKEMHNRSIFTFSKSVQPTKFPQESFMLQQGLCGFGYLMAGIPWEWLGAVIGHITGHVGATIQGPRPVYGLIAQGTLCVMAPVAQGILPERSGIRNPRSVSNGLLLASSALLGVGAAETGSGALAAAAGLFATSNILGMISRRGFRAAPHSQG